MLRIPIGFLKVVNGLMTSGQFARGDKVSVHVAANIAAKDERIHLVWSRSVLEEMCGQHGNYFSMLSMNEATNFFTCAILVLVLFMLLL